MTSSRTRPQTRGGQGRDGRRNVRIDVPHRVEVDEHQGGAPIRQTTRRRYGDRGRTRRSIAARPIRPHTHAAEIRDDVAAGTERIEPPDAGIKPSRRTPLVRVRDKILEWAHRRRSIRMFRHIPVAIEQGRGVATLAPSAGQVVGKKIAGRAAPGIHTCVPVRVEHRLRPRQAHLVRPARLARSSGHPGRHTKRIRKLPRPRRRHSVQPLCCGEPAVAFFEQHSRRQMDRSRLGPDDPSSAAAATMGRRGR